MKRNTLSHFALTVTSVAILHHLGMLNAQAQNRTFFKGGLATWSVQTNTQSWNQGLGVKYTRQGCNEAPASCLAFVGGVAQAEHVRVTLAIPLTADTPTYAHEYSQLSRSATYLAEISIDDFVDQYRALFTSLTVQPSAVVGETILNLKSLNRNLRFGVTIYEDELASPYLQNAKLPAAIRARVDFVHLFIHYREDGPNFPSYVQQARLLFPHARIVAGSYAYDRRAYISCGHSGPACTEQQDFDLFKQSLTIQTQEMKQGVVDHIEFYPGYFGNEAQWTGWSNPRECAPENLTACIDNTITMREAALTILNATSGTPTWNPLSPSGTPPAARYGHSAAMDSVNHRMILFGGNTFNANFNDTWILTNADGQHGPSAWLQVAAKDAPPATSYSQGMYDSANNRMIVYGGAALTDVWVLTNANALESDAPAWIQLHPLGSVPPILSDWEKHVYDPIRNVLIVYDSTAGVWVLSNANGLGGTPEWSQLNVAVTGPSGRAVFTVVYNPESNRMIAFGGSDGTTVFNDIWVLTNANGQGGTPEWIPLPTGTATLPEGHEGHTAVYDPVSDTMTLFGGIGLSAETWTATHASGLTQPPVWKLTNSGIGLDPRTWETAVLDTNSLSMTIFGGLTNDVVNSVFVLSPVL